MLRRYSPEKYFTLEKKSEVRHEYVEGEVFAMVRTSVAHNLIKGNLIAGLRPGVRQRGCRIFDENVRLEVREKRYYTYPDVLVSCTPADFQDPYVVRQPVLIAEILSPSTAEYDRKPSLRTTKKCPACGIIC